MNDTLLWFAIVTASATAGGVRLFSDLYKNIDLPFTTRIGMGFMGAALGSLFGIMMASIWHIDHGLLGRYAFPITIAISLALAMQKFAASKQDSNHDFGWFDNWFD